MCSTLGRLLQMERFVRIFIFVLATQVVLQPARAANSGDGILFSLTLHLDPQADVKALTSCDATPQTLTQSSEMAAEM